jgi:hypothetical protein
MKAKVFLIIGLVIAKNSLISQMNIGPSLGIDISQISEPPESRPYFDVHGSSFSNISMCYGVLAEQSLDAKSIISLRSSITNKAANASTSGFAAIDKIWYLHCKNSLEFKYFLHKIWKIGAGYNLSLGSNQRVTYLSSDSQKYKFTETGLVFSSGITINKFLLEILYYHSFAIKYGIEPGVNKIQPINSLVISASYLFKIRDKAKSKSIECPGY